MSLHPPHSGNKDNLQRALNDQHRQTLAARFGARFNDSPPDLPPEVEARWLERVEYLEEAFAGAEIVSIREFVGHPTFAPIGSVPHTQLRHEISKILDYLKGHQIIVEFLGDVADEVAYTFLTVELMDKTIENIRIDGLLACYIYEEDHPNDRLAVEQQVTDFFWHLFHLDGRFVEILFPRGEPRLAQSLRRWISSIAVFTTHITTISECSVTGDDAVVRVATRWSGLVPDTMAERSGSGDSVFHLHRGCSGGFEIVEARIAGFE